MAINFLNSVDFNKNELLNPTIENQPNDTAAGTGVEGQLYFNTTDDILKVYAGGSWVEVGGGVTSLTTTDGTYINLTPNSATTGAVTVTADLSAVDGTAGAGERYLAKSGVWATVASIAGTTYDLTGSVSNTTDFAISLSGSDSTLDKVFLKATNYITLTDGGSNDVTITHASTSRSDSTSTPAQLAFGDTFDAVTSVTTNSTGHVTAINVATYELPDAPADPTITLTGEVTGSGTTSISTTVANGVLDVANFNASAIVIESEGIENNDNDTTLPTSAAVKAYVDAATVGGLVYQGGYNASTNTPDLTTSPNSIEKGWTYTVTADGTFFGEQLRVGDVLIAEVDDPSALADWTTVQNNIDLASLTQVGIGNVNPGEAIDVSYSSGTATISAEDSTGSNKGVIIVSKETNADYRGIYVNYDAPGEVSVGLDIDTIPEDATPPMTESVMVYHDQQVGENYSIQISDLLALASSQTSYAATITDSVSGTTFNHGLGEDVIVQLYDTSTKETVYADVQRNGNYLNITFATTPTNSIRVLVQKIG